MDDDIVMREALAYFVEDEGYSMKAVGSAREFYQCLDQESFDVAVIDIGLPDQSGYVLAEYVRHNTDLGIIILTAHSDIEHRIRGYSCGADLYLVKPVNMRELVAAIENLAKRHLERHSQPMASMNAWVLHLSTRLLISPDGVEINLTGKEFNLVRILAEADENLIGRRQLLTLLAYPEDDYLGRAFDSLMLRLRNKIRKLTGEDAPVLNFHGVGYCFSGQVNIQ